MSNNPIVLRCWVNCWVVWPPHPTLLAMCMHSRLRLEGANCQSRHKRNTFTKVWVRRWEKCCIIWPLTLGHLQMLEWMLSEMLGEMLGEMLDEKFDCLTGTLRKGSSVSKDLSDLWSYCRRAVFSIFCAHSCIVKFQLGNWGFNEPIW